MNRNRIKVRICGLEYPLITDDDVEYVQSVAREVERQMEDLMHGNNRISPTDAAVLTAMSCCDDELKASQAVDELRAQMKEYLADSVRTRGETEEARQQIDRLKAQIRDLNTELPALTEKNAADARARMDELDQAHRQISALREELRVLKSPPVPKPETATEGEMENQTHLELPDRDRQRSASANLSAGEFMSLFDTFAGKG